MFGLIVGIIMKITFTNKRTILTKFIYEKNYIDK